MFIVLQFVLDSQPLNKHEKNLVGYYQNFNNWSAAKQRAKKLKRSSGFSTPARRTTDTTPASSIGSFRSFQFEGSTSSTGTHLLKRLMFNGTNFDFYDFQRIYRQPTIWEFHRSAHRHRNG